MWKLLVDQVDWYNYLTKSKKKKKKNIYLIGHNGLKMFKKEHIFFLF